MIHHSLDVTGGVDDAMQNAQEAMLYGLASAAAKVAEEGEGGRFDIERMLAIKDTILLAELCYSVVLGAVAAMAVETDLPTALECNTRSEDHGLCVEDQEFESTSRDFSAQALGADLAKEVAGVSFMQEGIERADALPGHFHKALTDSILSIPMLLAMLTMLMLWTRCTVPLTSREQKEPTTPASVDAWCVQGQATDTECEGKWLCHELIVPRSSKCAVTMPRMLKAGPWTALVSDKMGQCMFKACTAEAGKPTEIPTLLATSTVSAEHLALNMHGPRTILRPERDDDEDEVSVLLRLSRDEEKCDLSVPGSIPPRDQAGSPVQVPKVALVFMAFGMVLVVGVVLAAVLRPPGYGHGALADTSLRHSSNLDEENAGVRNKASRPQNMCMDCDPCADQVQCVGIVDAFFQNAAKGQLGLFRTYQQALNAGACANCDLSADFGSLVKRCDVYDNAVAAIYLTKRGNYEEARGILDVFLRLLYPTYYGNIYPEELFAGASSGLTVRLLAASYNCDMLPEASSFASPMVVDEAVDSGDNAWAALALAHFAFVTGQSCYGTAANDILEAIAAAGTCHDDLSGFLGRLPPKRGHQRATEHHIDLFALAGMLGNTQLQQRASRFIQKMHGRHEAYPDAYALGTGAQGRCDSGRSHYDLVPTDAQFWSFLADADPNHGAVGSAISWSIYSDWLWDTDVDTLSGKQPPPQLHGTKFTSKGSGVQWEETAGAAMALAHFLYYHSKGSDADFILQLKYRLTASRLSLRTLLKTYGAVPASVRGGNGNQYNLHNPYAPFPGGSDTGMGFTYLRMIHTASTAWTGLLMLYQATEDDPVFASANPMRLDGEVPVGGAGCLPVQDPPAAAISTQCLGPQ
ncbi:lacC [Symbiodinium natans]|uniref:LacC protein n=1 Tax=Symbiodinium natans TaxID=878477 RepID=A0A812RDU7_9DINO|nr:lacC [Symbiodinium natans]